MANGHGGKRTPSNPAPVSGPGRLARRTDGQPVRDIPSGSYGDAQDFHEIQTSAPMPEANGVQTPSASVLPGPSASELIPFGAPSMEPDTPLTDGSASGAGRGTEAIAFSDDDQYQQLRQYLPVLLKMADLPGTSPAARAAIRYLRGVV